MSPVPQIDLSEIEEEGIDPREIGHVLDRIFLSIFLALTVCVTALFIVVSLMASKPHDKPQAGYGYKYFGEL